jgi:catechol 2,3-dioxygenase-like lactoylglutathione lyase family enzyme
MSNDTDTSVDQRAETSTPGSLRPDARGLHNRINRISHWDFNVTDLERSREWYEATTGLRAIAETSADQAFPGLGIDHGRFRGYMMKDISQDGGFPMIHLVQWEEPTPVGKPYLSQANVGWYRIVPLVADIDASRAAVEAQGGTPFFPTTNEKITFHPQVPEFKYRVFGVHDPDGITVEFGEIGAGHYDIPKVPACIANNTTNPDKYLPFYTDVLGLDLLQGAQTPGPVPNVFSPIGGESRPDGAFFGMRGDNRVFFDWLAWSEADDYPTPYQEPNHVGIIRCSFEVDDLDHSYEILQNSSWAREGHINVAAPEEWNWGPQFGSRRVVTFTDPEGVGYQLLEQPASPYTTMHPYDA